ncbi:MAG: hypothetical protein JOY61_04940 [Chloroflexi bacterium]|nr:hypothetical protein [Chloroflexota bacterium]
MPGRLRFAVICLVVISLSLLLAVRLSRGSEQQTELQPALQAVSLTPPTLSRGCPISGDLVGDTDPATVAAALCGP